MSLTHVTDHATRAMAKLVQQYRDHPDFKVILDAFSKQIQALEDAIWDLYTYWGLDAFGARLDQTGVVLGEPREGDLDGDYRVRLRAKWRARKSKGTYQDMLDVFALLLPGNLITFDVYGSAGFLMRVGQTVVEHVEILRRFLREARAAGVNGQATYRLQTAATTFRMAVGSTLVVDAAIGAHDLLVVNNPLAPWAVGDTVRVSPGTSISEDRVLTAVTIAGTTDLQFATPLGSLHPANSQVTRIAAGETHGFDDANSPGVGGHLAGVLK